MSFHIPGAGGAEIGSNAFGAGASVGGASGGAGGHPQPFRPAENFSLSTPSHSRSPFRANSFASAAAHNADFRRRSSSRQTGTSASSASRPTLSSRPVLLWTHEPPNFSSHELVLNPDLIAAFGGVSDGSELLELRLPETSSKGNPIGNIAEEPSTATASTADDRKNGGRHGGRAYNGNGHVQQKRRERGIAKKAFLFKASQAVGDLDCIERCGANLQLSVAKNIATIFNLFNRCEAQLSKVPRSEHTISHIELYFRDQYVGRADMWRLLGMLDDSCVYVGQRVTLAGCVRATVGRIFINEKKVMSGYVGSQTRAIFRSESAKYNVFLQMASEMWDFDEDGEMYYEKALSGFLPDLVQRWKNGSTTHVVSIILFARVHYDEEELYMLQEADLPLRQESEGKRRWYIDYYKVMVDLESDCDWSNAIMMLKEEFFRFRHDILLLRRPVSGPAGAPWLEEQHADLLRRDRALLAGTLSASHEGNILEAINLALNPFDEHYIDRDLNRTGLDLVVISAGTGHFDVDKRLLRLTTERLIDNGIGLDLVCLTKMPLHSVPLFHFQSPVPTPEPGSQNQATGSWSAKRRSRTSAQATSGAGGGARSSAANPLPDPLYFDPSLSPPKSNSDWTGNRSTGLTDFYSIPHWIDCSFYNLQQDKPFRADRFVPRCKMHEVQMLGLMENEISDIALPYIDFARIPGVAPPSGQSLGKSSSHSSILHLFSSSGGKHSRLEKSFGDISALSNREQRKLLREKFDKEQFRDLENIPTAIRPLMVQGLSEKNLSHVLSASPPQIRPSSRTGMSSGSNLRESDLSLPLGIQTSGRSARSTKAGRDSLLTLPALASHEEHPDYAEQDIARRDSCNRQAEPASPRQKRISILPSFGSNATLASTSTHAAPGGDLKRVPSQSGSLRSVNTLSHGLRPLSDMGKAKALVASTEVTYKAAALASGEVKATDAATKVVKSEADEGQKVDRTPTKTSGYSSWIWSTLRRKPANEDKRRELDDKESYEASPLRASLKIQAMLKHQTGSRAGDTSSSRPPSLILPQEKLGESTDSSTDTAMPSPILIPSHQGPADSSKAKEKGGPSPSNGAGKAEGEGHTTMTIEQEALEQELEEQEAKARYAQQAQVEKQTLVNPCNPRKSLKSASNNQVMRWQHAFPRRLNQHVVKWRSMTTPACLPLTTMYLPSETVLKSQWQEYPYQMSVASDMQSFLVKRASSTPPALAVLREMASQRLAQGYQFIVPIKSSGLSYTSASAMPDGRRLREPWELFQPGSLASGNPIFLSITNQIHRIHYDRSSNCIYVKRFVRRVEYDTSPSTYTCCVWARNLTGYQTVNAVFRYPDFGAYNWTHLDAVIAGHSDDETFTEQTHYWRTRFVVVPSEGSPQTLRGPSGEKLSDEEVRLAGMDRLADLFNRARWRPKAHSVAKRNGQRAQTQSAPLPPLRFIPTSLDPAMSLKDDEFMRQVEAAHHDESREMETRRQEQRSAARASRTLADTTTAEAIKLMYATNGQGLPINDRLWNKTLYRETFSGSEFVTWLCQEFVDVPTRESAAEWGQKFIKEGLLQHVHEYHGFLDGHYFYRISPHHAPVSAAKAGEKGAAWFGPKASSAGVSSNHPDPTKKSDGGGGKEEEKGRRPTPTSTTNGAHGLSKATHSPRKGSRRLLMSRSMILDVDPGKRSERAEVAFLHHDLAHNPANGFNFQIHWLGSTARFIEDLVQMWTRTVERFGLRLIEAPINQIKDVSTHNPFQAPLPIPLALYPPQQSAFSALLPGHVASTHLFEYALLRRFGFILDQEATEKYRNISKEIIIDYRSRPNHFDYSQFVHRSGVAFVQVLPENGGFLWLDNRLFNSHLHSERHAHHVHTGGSGGVGGAGAGQATNPTMDKELSSSSASSALPSADRVRHEFVKFCSDVNTLEQFYEDVLEQLRADYKAAMAGTGNEPGKENEGMRKSSSTTTSGPASSPSTREAKRA